MTWATFSVDVGAGGVSLLEVTGIAVGGASKITAGGAMDLSTMEGNAY